MLQTIMYRLNETDRNMLKTSSLYDVIECVRIFDGPTFWFPSSAIGLTQLTRGSAR
jgi:hypothetical protein